MVPVIFGILAAVGASMAVAVVMWGDSPESAPDTVMGRLDRYTAKVATEAEARRNIRAADIVGDVRDALSHYDQRKGAAQLADSLSRADIPLRATEWTIALFAVGLALFVVCAMIWNVWVALVVGVVVPVFGGRFLISYRHRRRLTKFEKQLADVALLLASALRAGHGFSQAVNRVAELAPHPIGTEFARTNREIELGMTVDEALERLVDRNRSDDLDLLITAVQINRTIGGNLSELLESIAFTIRERVRIKGQIRTVTAQGRLSGWIITLLPIALVAILLVVASDYFRPMFTNGLGIAMLCGSALSMLISAVWIRRILKIKVL